MYKVKNTYEERKYMNHICLVFNILGIHFAE